MSKTTKRAAASSVVIADPFACTFRFHDQSDVTRLRSAMNPDQRELHQPRAIPPPRPEVENREAPPCLVPSTTPIRTR